MACASLGVKKKLIRAQSGFTLIELIVVILIIGVIMSFALLSVSGRAQDDRLENEARRVVELFRLASDEAILLGIELGLSSDGENYEFVTIGEEGRWVRYQENGPFRPRKLSDGVEIEIITEDFAVPKEKDKKKSKEAPLPSLLFLSSGELTPFQLLVSAIGADQTYVIAGELTGKLTMRRLGEDESAANLGGRR